jgi:hypothetical protein
VSTSRPACAVVGALLLTLCVAACGSSGSNTSSNANAGAGPPGAARRGFLQDPKVVACLKQQGVTIPSRRGGGGGPPGAPNSQPPTDTNRRPPSGQGQPNPGSGSPQFQKLRAALQKCGVTFQGRPPNGQPPPGGQGTTSTSAS